jgi:lipid II:glycine glycyltransferase (peptidoglycan interpeptide bridge formation enzyme)
MVEIFGKQYFGTIKVKKIGPWKLQRYQIMGVELPSDVAYVRSEVEKIKKQFRKKCFFFQWGITNEILSFENSVQKSEEFREDMKAVRRGLTTILHDEYGLKTAFRENMPTAGIVYDTTKSDEELLKDMNESCRKRIKKSIAGGMQYAIIEEKEYETFFAQRQKTADAKGFNTISKKQYE